MGLKEAKDVVEDYGRRNKLRPTPACAGNQTVWWVWTAAILVLLLLSILGGSIAPHLTRRHQWFFVHAMTALSWGLVVLSLVFSGVAVYQVLRKGRKPPN
jgi:small-conductance mechanosensitive channel